MFNKSANRDWSETTASAIHVAVTGRNEHFPSYNNYDCITAFKMVTIHVLMMVNAVSTDTVQHPCT